MAVLLVEDDLLIRLTLADFFSAAGVEVIEASNAEDAWAVLRGSDPHIKILVTDLNLGDGANGLVLARKARQAFPDLRIVYATGSPELLEDHTAATWETMFFKPFDPALLVAAVAAKLNPSRPQ